MMMVVRPAATASSITYWMIGLSTSGSISFGCALVAGRNRVPRPAAGKTALRMRAMSDASIHPSAMGVREPMRVRGPPVLDVRKVVDEREAVEAGLRRRGFAFSEGGDPWVLDAERRAVIGE